MQLEASRYRQVVILNAIPRLEPPSFPCRPQLTRLQSLVGHASGTNAQLRLASLSWSYTPPVDVKALRLDPALVPELRQKWVVTTSLNLSFTKLCSSAL